MRKSIALLLATLALLLSPSSVHAFFDPTSVDNNRVGIHILDENDILNAKELVNSSGGDWGYVTLVIREDEMDQSRWQKMFDSLREARLIPIVRIATSMNKNSWTKPSIEDANKWAEFLNSLNWVIENRYVVLFNEPNHDKEWGGKSSPVEYAEVAKAFVEKLKEKSNDFFVLPAGMDVAASNTGATTDAYQFWEKMAESQPDIFKKFDGWNSHSYPNPGFSGNVADNSRQSINSYEKEILFLEKFGLRRNIPIFITETGWLHEEGVVNQPELLTSSEVGDNLVKAYTSVWNNPQIVAVTPFVMNYTISPFDHFSFIDPRGNRYPQFEKIQSIKKVAGRPKQKIDFKWVENPIPEELFLDSNYTLVARIQNTGQSIWNDREYELVIDGNYPEGSTINGKVPVTRPNEIAEIEFGVKTPDVVQTNSMEIYFTAFGQKIGNSQIGETALIPPAALELRAQLGLKRSTRASDFRLLVYEGIRFIKEIDMINFVDGLAKVTEIKDLVPNKAYRFVLTKPYYLPVQKYKVIDEIETKITFPLMMPVDLNLDGQLTGEDFLIFLTNPLMIVGLLI